MSKRILVVDDDPHIRRIVAMALSDESPYDVQAVSSGEAALLQLTRQPCDLLFTDIRMPGMDGIELVRRVRELQINIPVIVFTVSPEDLSPTAAATLKIDALLEKPVEPEKLRIAVDLLLDPARLLPTAQNVRPSAAQERAAPMPVSERRKSGGTGTLGQRIAASQARRIETESAEGAPVAMHLTSNRPGKGARNYSASQIEAMRLALKDLALEPDVHCAILIDISGIVLTHWSRRRDINVTVVAALAAGNSLALTEIGRNLGQQRPGGLIIQEGFDQSMIMAHMDDLLLLLAIGPQASLGWARITTMRTCEEVVRIAHGSS